MEPIISPWTLYLAGLCSKILIIGLLLTILGLAMIAIIIVSAGEGHESLGELYRDNRWWCKCSVILLFIGIVCFTFIPTEATAMRMLAASVVTPDNLATVNGNLIDFIQEVADAIEKAKG